MKRLTALLLTLVLSHLFSCVDEAPRYTIPYARVFFQIDLGGLDSDLSLFSYKLFTNGRTVGEQTGYAGLLIFRTHQGDLAAYDLCCPHEDNRAVKVQPTGDGKAVCPECGSVFVTMYGLGSVESGPSAEPLQSYPVRKKPQREETYLVTN